MARAAKPVAKDDVKSLTGAERAAVIMLSLGEEHSERIWRMMDEDDWAEREGEWFSRRLDHGLFGLQTADVVLAWLVAEEAGAKKAVLEGLGGSLTAVKESLSEQLEGVEDEDSKDMLATLVSFLG